MIPRSLVAAVGTVIHGGLWVYEKKAVQYEW